MKTNNLHKILVANRSEIAARIISAIHKTGKIAVAIYAQSDKDLPYVSMADEAWALGEGSISNTYLNIGKIIEIAKDSGAEAIHPGYGFLSENADFAKACQENNLVFIGPDPNAIELMGNKSNARLTAEKLGVPIVKGMTGTSKDILHSSEKLVFPLLIKPSAGGGGKGMHIVNSENELDEKLKDAVREAKNYFGSEELYVEHYIESARHIEVQVLGDQHGNVIHLFERECSLQRRYQKIIEEAPSISISDATRKKLTDSALKLARGIDYHNAGTVEFLADEDEHFYFIEMNTRIQVEHPVTEQVTGIDIVAEQIRIAENKKLQYQQDEIILKGHAIEARLYAENPESEFMPSTGRIHASDVSKIQERIDFGYATGNTVTPYYDPMIAKVIALGTDRLEAAEKLASALENYHVSGIRTNKSFLLALINSEDFIQNNIYTKYIDRSLDDHLVKMQKKNTSEMNEIMVSLSSVIALTFNYNENKNNSIWFETGHWRQHLSIKMLHDGSMSNIEYEILKRKKEFNLTVNGSQKHAELLNRQNGHYKVLLDNQQYSCWADVNCSEIWIDYNEVSAMIRRTDIPDERYSYSLSNNQDQSNIKEIIAPLNGKVVKLNVKNNEKVKKGDILVVIESMKMENKITSPGNAEIAEIYVKAEDLIEQNKILIKLK